MAMKRVLAAILGVAMLITASTALALPSISGTISFVGNASYTGGTTAATAEGIHFLPAFGFFPGEFVAAASGDYSGTVGQLATFTDFKFKPSLFPSTVSPLWTFTVGGTTYDFEMTSISYLVAGNHLVLDGSGTLGITGFADTPGSWAFSTEDNASANLTFSATSAVPEPGTILLLGGGLLGLAFYGRRRMKA
jgi:hypothetical protein